MICEMCEHEESEHDAGECWHIWASSGQQCACWWYEPKRAAALADE